MALQSAAATPRLLWSWAILLGAFAVDAGLTLVRRMLRGERWYEAHRSHAYQRASRRLGKHGPISLLVAAINVLWLLPWAWLAMRGWLSGPVALASAYAPLLVLALWCGAGAGEAEGRLAPATRPVRPE
jgi:Fuc2NAc and GlcNAc transferase